MVFGIWGIFIIVLDGILMVFHSILEKYEEKNNFFI
jgi:hypothetical protein